MKILCLHLYFYPDCSAVAQIVTEWAEDLAQLGNDVRVVASRGSYVGNLRLAKREVYRGVTIRRLWSPRLGKRSELGRLFDYLVYLVLATAYALFAPSFDVSVILATPPLLGLAGVVLRFFRGRPYVLWVQDLYPDIALALGILKRGSLLAAIFNRLALWTLSRAALIVPISNGMRRVFERKGVPAEKIAVISNWSDGDLIRPLSNSSNPFRLAYYLDGAFVVLYSGNLGRAHEFETILAAAGRLARRGNGMKFVFVGDGVRRREIEDHVAKVKLSNVLLLPYQPKEELAFLFAACDVALVSQRPEVEGLMFPSKLYGILASGRPVVCVADPVSELARIVEDHQCGCTVAPGAGERLVEILLWLAANPIQRRRLGNNARRTFEQHFDRKLATQRFAKCLASLPGEGTSRVRHRRPIQP